MIPSHSRSDRWTALSGPLARPLKLPADTSRDENWDLLSLGFPLTKFTTRFDHISSSEAIVYCIFYKKNLLKSLSLRFDQVTRKER